MISPPIPHLPAHETVEGPGPGQAEHRLCPESGPFADIRDRRERTSLEDRCDVVGTHTDRLRQRQPNPLDALRHPFNPIGALGRVDVEGKQGNPHSGRLGHESMSGMPTRIAFEDARQELHREVSLEPRAAIQR